MGRPKAEETFEQFSMRVPSAVVERLKALARAEDRPASNMARRALIRGLDELERERAEQAKRRR